MSIEHKVLTSADLYRQLYSEIKLKEAVSIEHLEKIRQKKAKRSNDQNYMNFIETVFPLEVILDSFYWKHLKSTIKFPQAPSVDFGAVSVFLSNSSGSEIPHITWINVLDRVSPYLSGYKLVDWTYITENMTLNPNIVDYTKKAKRTSFCSCIDGCQDTKKCPCYRWNRKLLKPTYRKGLCKDTGTLVTT